MNFCGNMQQGFVVQWTGSDPAGSKRSITMKPLPLFGSMQKSPAVLRNVFMGQSNFCRTGWKDEAARFTAFSRLLHAEALLNVSDEQSPRAENVLNSHRGVTVMAF